MAKGQSAEGAQPSTALKDIQPTEASNVERELEAMMLMGKRNLDAAWSINRLAVECIQQCAERQAQVWGKFSTNALSMLGIFGAQAHGNAPTFRKSPVIADTIELTLGHMRELSEIIARANQEALDVISNRSNACLKEVEEAAKRNISTLMESSAQSAVSFDRDTLARGKRPGSSGKT